MPGKTIQSLRTLYTDPILKPLNAVLAILILAYIGLTLVVTPSGIWLALLLAVLGPWAVVSGVYFDGVRSDTPLQRTHAAFFIAVLSGLYALFIGITLWIDLLALAPDTDTVRMIAGAATGLPVTAALYGWALRHMD